MTTHALPISFRIGRRFAREESGTRHGRKEGVRVMTPQPHESVLLKEVIELLAPKDGDIVLDATAGAGGHSEALLSSADVRLFAIDADRSAAEAVRKRLARFKSAEVLEGNFRNAAPLLAAQDIDCIDKALFDLGWNRGQLYAGRGFSFMGDEPLLMSYGEEPSSGFTARAILNTWSEEAIADVLFGYGEERYARRIARAVAETRRKTPIETTAQFVDLIGGAVPAGYRHGKTHFATKSFQALRIAVNDELRALDEGVRGAWNLLAKGGRLAVISFHSTEDRAVKNLFKEFASGGGRILTKKPITASEEELKQNPSSRSAKLRGIEKN